MKKNYNCPAVEVMKLQATYNMLSESNPFQMGGEGKDQQGQQIDPV
jgi:hypothetical protein